MVSWLHSANANDTNDITVSPSMTLGATSKHFYDFATSKGIHLVGNGVEQQYIFGNDTDNGAIAGLAGDDHLYGGAGNDTLTGNNGNDHLEGNEDNDNLDGGAGNDKLLGGQGDDSLKGGKGDDILQGGLGTDTYTYTTGDGLDSIVDSDGAGKIQWDSLEIKGSSTLGLDPAKWLKLSDTVWSDETNHVTYSLKAQADGSKNLYINKLGDELEIKGWQAGNLGIALGNGADPVPPAHLYNGDQRAPLSGTGYSWGAVTWAADGTLVGGVAEANFNDVIVGDQQAAEDKDTINGLGGNDALDGREGDDTIDGGEGDDLIGGGKGSDTLHGGAGNDEILSATGLTVPQRTSPDEVWQDIWQLPASTVAWVHGSTWGIAGTGGTYTIYGGGSLAQDTAPDVVFGEGGDDRIIGGLGDDYLDGGLDDDAITGHGGNDLLDGGDGVDYIDGDGEIQAGFYQTVAVDAHGNDALFGGAGADTLIGGGKDDRLFGETGDDHLWGDHKTETDLAGQYHGNDYLDGGDGVDQLVGGGRDDTLLGGIGNDLLWGDALTKTDLDVLYHGNDYLDGGDGIDQLIGGGKDDTLKGGAGNDKIFGDDLIPNLAAQYHGNDNLDGGDGDDSLYGGGGNDTLLGGGGIDLLQGDDGNDYLDGGDGLRIAIAGGLMQRRKKTRYLRKNSYAFKSIKASQPMGRSL